MKEITGEFITILKTDKAGEYDLEVVVETEGYLSVRTHIIDPEDSDYEFLQVMSHEEIEALYHYSQLIKAGEKA